MTPKELAEFKAEEERLRQAFATHHARVKAFESRQFTLDECVWIAAAFKPVMQKYLEVGAVPVKGFMDLVFKALGTLEDSVFLVEDDPESDLQEDEDAEQIAYRLFRERVEAKGSCQ